MSGDHYSTNTLDRTSPEINRGGNSVGDAARVENGGMLESASNGMSPLGRAPKGVFTQLTASAATQSHMQNNIAAMGRMSGPPQR